MGSPDRALAQLADCTGRFVAAHPRSLTAAVALALAGFGVTAFGIAPMAPDASDLPRRLVTEIVATDNLQTQLDALADHEIELYRNDLTRASDTADTLLRRLGVSDAAAASFLRRDATARQVLEGRAGKIVQVRTDATGALEELAARFAATDARLQATHFTRLTVTRTDAGLQTRVETLPLATQVRMGSGVIHSTLFAATDEARIPDAIASQLAEVFATDIDFRAELRRGDSFSLIYETLTADGEPITWGSNSGRLLAAEFVNGGQRHEAVWYQDPLGKGAYFDFNGQSKKRSLLASPLEFSRVTSGFAMRMHPILNTWRQHKGVDYGAPAGTAVRSVGDGVVEFAGWQNGYGNVVEVAHSNGRSTVYAHLSRLGVRKGDRVQQGDTVGAVGSTGWATGPHLHFEFKVAGEQRNPLTIAQASEAVSIAPASRARFLAWAADARSQLGAAATVANAGEWAE